jgi:hypothetical protein
MTVSVLEIHCNGACQCEECAPDQLAELAQTTMTSEAGPFVVPEWHRAHYPNFTVVLDGYEVQDQTMSAYAGQDGWVVALQRDAIGELHVCRRCRRSICKRVLRGAVSVHF